MKRVNGHIVPQGWRQSAVLVLLSLLIMDDDDEEDADVGPFPEISFTLLPEIELEAGADSIMPNMAEEAPSTAVRASTIDGGPFTSRSGRVSELTLTLASPSPPRRCVGIAYNLTTASNETKMAVMVIVRVASSNLSVLRDRAANVMLASAASLPASSCCCSVSATKPTFRTKQRPEVAEEGSRAKHAFHEGRNLVQRNGDASLVLARRRSQLRQSSHDCAEEILDFGIGVRCKSDPGSPFASKDLGVALVGNQPEAGKR